MAQAAGESYNDLILTIDFPSLIEKGIYFEIEWKMPILLFDT